MTSPLISFVIPARNDQYAGNANYRLQITLDFLAMGLYKLDRASDAEIIVVDWGSDVPLSDTLSLSEYARQITRFVVVQNHLTKEICLEHGFPTPMVLNAGIRRASGMFIAQTLADVLFPQRVLAGLFDICDNKMKSKTPTRETLFICNRKQVPKEIVDRQPPIAELGEFIEKYDNDLPVEFHPFSLTPSDCQLMYRDLWQECRGYDERYVYWGWTDVDLVIRMRLKYSASNMMDKKFLYVYHLNHYVPPSGSRKVNHPFFNSFTVNDETWGLADYQFEEIPSAASPRLLPASLPVQPENMVASKREYVLLVLKFALSKPTWRNIRAAKSFLKAIISSGPQDSIWYRLYYFGRKLRKANRNRQAMPANVEERSDSQ